jgi:hypothetical protein
MRLAVFDTLTARNSTGTQNLLTKVSLVFSVPSGKCCRTCAHSRPRPPPFTFSPIHCKVWHTFFFLWRFDPISCHGLPYGASPSLRHPSLGRTLLDEESARRGSLPYSTGKNGSQDSEVSTATSI